MSASELLPCLGGLALVALCGRVVLALLPPGDPGRHDPRAPFASRPASWAASHLAGAAGLLALARLAACFGREPGWAFLLVPFALLGALRLFTLPAAIAPRHELPPAAGGTPVLLARLLALGTCSALAWSVLVAPAAPPTHDAALGALLRVVALARGGALAPAALSAASLVALVVLVERGLERARRAPGSRAFAAAALALVLLPDPARAVGEGLEPAAALAALGGAGALALACAWLRRADRRGLALAAFGSALVVLALPRASALALGPALAVPLAAALPVRRLSLGVLAAALVPAVVLAALSGGELGWAGGGLAPSGGLAVRVFVALALVGLTALGLQRAKRQLELAAEAPAARKPVDGGAPAEKEGGARTPASTSARTGAAGGPRVGIDAPARELAGAALGAALLFAAAPREPATSLAATAAAGFALALYLLPPELEPGQRRGPPKPLAQEPV